MRGRACRIQPYLIISILLSSNKNDTSRASPWPKRHLWHIHLVLAIWDRSGGLTICLIMANYPYTLNLRSLEHPHGLLEAPVKTDLELATICCLMALHTSFRVLPLTVFFLLLKLLARGRRSKNCRLPYLRCCVAGTTET